MKHTDPIPSYLPPAWGGPFMWLRNAAGNLELLSIPKLTGAAKAAFEALEKRVTR